MNAMIETESDLEVAEQQLRQDEDIEKRGSTYVWKDELEQLQ